MKKEKYLEYDIIRVIATVLVVIGHAGYISPMTEYGGIQMMEYSVPIMQKLIDLGIRIIYSFHMPLFLVLSGATFYSSINREKLINWKTLITKKAKRLLWPFLLCNLLWVIPLKFLSGYWSNSVSVVYDIIVGQILLCGNNHLWYLWVLFVITCISYFFRKHDRLRIVLGCIMFLIGCIVDVSFLGITLVLLNYIWFEVGILYGKYRTNILEIFNKMKWKALIGSVGIYAFVLFAYLIVAKGNQFIYGIVNFAGVLMCLIICFSLAKTRISKNKLYQIILSYSFYIYLLADTINYPILSCLKAMNWNWILSTNLGAFILFIFRVGFSICLAVIINVFINRFKLIVRKLRGECLE